MPSTFWLYQEGSELAEVKKYSQAPAKPAQTAYCNHHEVG